MGCTHPSAAYSIGSPGQEILQNIDTDYHQISTYGSVLYIITIYIFTCTIQECKMKRTLCFCTVQCLHCMCVVFFYEENTSENVMDDVIHK